jgi:hypothetical protein
MNSSVKTRAWYYWLLITVYVFFLAPSFYYAGVSPKYELKADNLVLRYIAEECNGSPYLYAGPFMPNLYFEARKINPTGFAWLITGHHTPGQFARAAQRIETARPACAILNYETVRKYNYNTGNPVDNYIKNNYRLDKVLGEFMFYKLD